MPSCSPPHSVGTCHRVLVGSPCSRWAQIVLAHSIGTELGVVLGKFGLAWSWPTGPFLLDQRLDSPVPDKNFGTGTGTGTTTDHLYWSGPYLVPAHFIYSFIQDQGQWPHVGRHGANMLSVPWTRGRRHRGGCPQEMTQIGRHWCLS